MLGVWVTWVHYSLQKTGDTVVTKIRALITRKHHMSPETGCFLLVQVVIIDVMTTTSQQSIEPATRTEADSWAPTIAAITTLIIPIPVTTRHRE